MTWLCYVGLFAVALGSTAVKEYAHRQSPISVADIPSYTSTTHDNTLNCPVLHCTETFYTSINEACDVEYQLWREVEKYCPRSSVTNEAWFGGSYDYFLHPRRYYDHYTRQQLIAFDINTKNGGAFGGASWRVIVRGSSVFNDLIQSSGRVIDHWNGTYTVYFALSIHGTYTVDIILEYAGCGGYASGLRRAHKAALDYVGHVERISITWNTSHAHEAPVTHHSSDVRVSLDVFRYLADTGHFVGTTWHPTQHNVACIPRPHLPKGNFSLTLAGDSTFRQIYNCLLGQMTCFGDDCAASKRMSDYCIRQFDDAAPPFTEENMAVWRQRRNRTTTSFVRVDHQVERVEAILEDAAQSNASEPLVLVVGVGLHPMVNMDWNRQKSIFLEIQKTVNKFPNVYRRDGSHATSGQTVYVIWKDVWAVHEYCFVPNLYWNRFMWSLRNTWFGWSFSSNVLQARDATAQLQNSFFMDQVLRKSNNIMYLPTYSPSKAFGKGKSEHDMRHHSGVVVVANVKLLLDLLGDSVYR